MSILFSVLPVAAFFKDFWLCGETDRGSSGRGTQNPPDLDHTGSLVWMPHKAIAVESDMPNLVMQAGRVVRQSGVSVEMWVCGLLFLMITLNFFKVIGVH